MRQLTQAAKALVATQLGVEPVCVVSVAWDGVNFISYADKDFQGVPGRILQLGNLDDVRNLSGSGGNAQLSVVLDDCDGTIKAIMDAHDVQKVPVRVYQIFTGLTWPNDAILLFFGAAVTPISWSEGEQRVAIEIISRVEAGGFGLYYGSNGEVGFSPEESQFPNVSPKLWTRTWPLAFGEVLNLPAVKSYQKVRGITVTGFGIPDYTLPYKYWHLIDRLSILADGFNYYLLLVNACRTLIGTQPVDLSALFDNFNYDHLADAANGVDATMIDTVTVNDSGQVGGQQLNYLDQIAIPQLYAGIPADQLLDTSDAIQVINQMEISYAQLIRTEQQAKQDHEDIAAFVQLYDKVLDKFNALLLQAPSQQDYINEVNGAIAYMQATLASRQAQTTDFVNQQVAIPTDQSALFSSQASADQPPDQALTALLSTITAEIAALQTLVTQLGAATTQQQWKSLVQAVTDEMTTASNQQKVLINSITATLLKIQGAKERLEIDMDNCEYAYKTILELNKRMWKVILDYHRTLHEVWKVWRAITDQSAMNSEYVVISDNNLFPQGEIQLNIKDMNFLGSLEGIVFIPTQILPKYSNVAVLPESLTGELDAFWVINPAIILRGCHCLAPFNIGYDDPDYDPTQPLPQIRWRIFRVKEQYGAKCIIELIENKERKSPTAITGLSVDGGAVQTQIPTLQTLPDDVESMFDGARSHTRQEIVRILENSIPKYEQNKLQQLRSTIGQLQGLIQKAKTDDDVAAESETITKDVNEYNARINNLNFKKEAVDRCLETITDKERAKLLKMENLKINIGLKGIDNTPNQIPPATRLYYITGFDIIAAAGIYQASLHMLPGWFAFSPGGQELVTNNTVIPLPGGHEAVVANYLPDSAFWFAPPGSECDVSDLNLEIYIANILPSEVVAVYGKITIDGVPSYVPLQAGMYIVNESDESYPPLTVTSITLPQPLSAYALGFENEVWVSLRSSVGGTAADVIAWVVENWTNLTVDAESFATVSGYLANYPVNFALFNKRDALKLIEQIAWESRCAVYIKNQTVYIQYLSKTPVTVDTITESDVEEGSLGYELTQTEDLVTKLIAAWQTDYLFNEKNKTIVRYNIPKYGLWERQYNFETYNTLALVVKSLTFWSMRYSNSWKRVTFKTFLTKLALETFDWVLLNFQQPYFANGPVPAMIERADYDSASSTITIRCWVPVRAGEMEKYAFAWPADLPIETIYPPVEDIVLGLVGNYANSAVPTDVPFNIQPNQNLIEAMQLAPKDYGGTFPADAGDTVPASALAGLSLGDFLSSPDISNYNLPKIPRAVTNQQGRPGIGYDGGGTGQPQQDGGVLNAGKIGPPSPTPMREVFHGRVTQLLDAPSQTYLVQATDGRQYSVEQRGGAAGTLNNGQVVTAVRDPALGKYAMNDRPDTNIGLFQQVQIQSVQDDYITCSIINGATVYVAKAYALQRTPWDGKAFTLGGQSISYYYQNGSNRTATSSSATEQQVVVPDYVIGETVVAWQTSTSYTDPTGSPIVLQDMNCAGRAWSRVYGT